jgi:hypothetical protein
MMNNVQKHNIYNDDAFHPLPFHTICLSMYNIIHSLQENRKQANRLSIQTTNQLTDH